MSNKVDTVGLYTGRFRGYMETSTGRKVNPFNVKEEDIDIRDIAHALSLLCRYGGHCKSFYSVAEHSIRASMIMEEVYQMATLMHDAAEAYLGDIVRPIKYQLPVFQEIEDKISQVIRTKFNIKWDSEIAKVIKEADNIIGATEGRDLMYHVEDWGNLPDPLPDIILPVSSPEAETAFLWTFNILYKEEKDG